jgi:hypothetical protein
MTAQERIARAGMALAVVAAVALAGCDQPEITPTRGISELVLPTGEPGPVSEEHFVMNWLLLGPFTFDANDFGGEHQQPAADKEFMPKERHLNGTQAPPKPATWQEKQFTGGDRPGQIDLDALYEGIEHAAAYAVCWLNCPEAVPDATLLVGSDDYITVWVNSKLVHCYKTERRAAEADQDKIENVALRKGYNRVVVKCVDVVLGWNFYLRLTDKDGKPIAAKAKLPAEK